MTVDYTNRPYLYLTPCNGPTVFGTFHQFWTFYSFFVNMQTITGNFLLHQLMPVIVVRASHCLSTTCVHRL